MWQYCETVYTMSSQFPCPIFWLYRIITPSKVKNGEAVPLLPHMSSWNGAELFMQRDKFMLLNFMWEHFVYKDPISSEDFLPSEENTSLS
jgi:hypothetical protein